MCAMHSAKQPAAGHGVDIGHPHLHAEAEWCRDSRRDLPLDLPSCRLVPHYSEYRNRCSAMRNGCGPVGCAVSAHSGNGAMPIVPSDCPVRPREIRSATARHNSRSEFEKPLVASSLTSSIRFRRSWGFSTTLRRIAGMTSSSRRCS